MNDSKYEEKLGFLKLEKKGIGVARIENEMTRKHLKVIPWHRYSRVKEHGVPVTL